MHRTQHDNMLVNPPKRRKLELAQFTDIVSFQFYNNEPSQTQCHSIVELRCMMHKQLVLNAYEQQVNYRI
jgi:hypothetical protein